MNIGKACVAKSEKQHNEMKKRNECHSERQRLPPSELCSKELIIMCPVFVVSLLLPE